MKNLREIFKLVAVAVIVALAILTIRAFAQGPSPNQRPPPPPPDRTLTLKFKDAQLNDDTENKFKEAIRALGTEQPYSVRVNHHNDLHDDYDNDHPPPRPASSGMKTDKVTTSELAKSAAGEFTAIGSHVSYNVTSDRKTDIQNILNTLK
jgi:hypothetical protein